jgi:hypothetical protein
MVSFFRRSKKKDEDVGEMSFDMDPLKDPGMIGLFFRTMGVVEDKFAEAVTTHLVNIHEPGGYAREKQAHDFMDLGMRREYLDALDDIEFTVDEVISAPESGLKKRGTATMVTRWKVRGVHSRPLSGVAPSGEQVTVEGITYTTFRNYNIRVEYTYWTSDLARRMVER